MPSLPRRLRVAEAHAGDLPAVADAGRARIPGRVRQSRHPRVPQPTLTSHSRAGLRRDGDFPACADSVRLRTSAFGRNSGDLRSRAVGAPVAQLVPGRREPFQARLAPTRRKRRATAKSNGVGVAICRRIGIQRRTAASLRRCGDARTRGAQAGRIRRPDGDRPACGVPGEAWPGVSSIRDSRRVQSAAGVQRDFGRPVSRTAAPVQRDGRMARRGRTGVRLTDPEALLGTVVLQGAPELSSVARDARERMVRVAESLAKG